MMCQCRFINCNKCTNLVEDGDSGTLCMCGAVEIWKSVPSSSFGSESKFVLKKIKYLKLKKKEKKQTSNQNLPEKKCRSKLLHRINEGIDLVDWLPLNNVPLN